VIVSAWEPSRFEILVDAILINRVFSRLYGRYVDSLGLRGDERVLDFGSGSGSMSRHIARRLLRGGGRVTCLDPSRTWMRIARRRLRRYPNVEFRPGTVEGLAGETAAFDAIVIHFMLHDIDRLRRASTVRALARSLKDPGRLFVREPTKAGHGMPADEVRRLMLGAGLREVASVESRLLLVGPYYAGVFEKAP